MTLLKKMYRSFPICLFMWPFLPSQALMGLAKESWRHILQDI